MPEAQTQRRLEICLETVADAHTASRGGADRLEIAASLLDGGLTPSLGLVEAVLSEVALPIRVMIRPRGGDFRYDAGERAVMARDIRHFTALGVHGFVLGCLDSEHEVDREALKELMDHAEGRPVTFHRAVDLTPDPVGAVSAIAAAGCDRILTSGGCSTALAGLDIIRRMVAAAATTQTVVMAGGGVRHDHIAQILRAGVLEIHASASVPLPADVGLALGRTDAPSPRRITDSDLVRAMARALRNG